MVSFFKLKKGLTFKEQGYIGSFLLHSMLLSGFVWILWQSKRGEETPFLEQKFPVYILFKDPALPSLSSGKEFSQKKVEKTLLSVSSKIQDPPKRFQELEKKRDVIERGLPFLENGIQKKQESPDSEVDSWMNSQEVNGGMKSSETFMEMPVVMAEDPLAYPQKALQQGQEGDVVLLLTIDQEGRVQEIFFRKRSGWGLLDSSAVENAKTLVFRPVFKDGKPIVIRLERTVSFRLEQKKNLSPLDRATLSRLDYNDDDLF